MNPSLSAFPLDLSRDKSSRACIRTEGGVLYLNPGSAGRRRFSLPVTLATLVLGVDGVRAEIHALDL